MKQFFYTVVDQEGKNTDKVGSFAVNLVTRTGEVEPGKLVVILQDWHQELIDKPMMNKKNGYTIQRVKDDVSSQILLNEADSTRYRNLVEIKTEVLGNLVKN